MTHEVTVRKKEQKGGTDARGRGETGWEGGGPAGRTLAPALAAAGPGVGHRLSRVSYPLGERWPTMHMLQTRFQVQKERAAASHTARDSLYTHDGCSFHSLSGCRHLFSGLS